MAMKPFTYVIAFLLAVFALGHSTVAFPAYPHVLGEVRQQGAPSPVFSPGSSPTGAPGASMAASPANSVQVTQDPSNSPGVPSVVPSPSSPPVPSVVPTASPTGDETALPTVTEETPDPAMGDGDDASPSPTEDDPICFPFDETVELKDGKVVQMGDLQIGDHVKVAPGEYSEVFMFTHRLADVDAEFVKISFLGSDEAIRMTPGHYLYANGRLTAAKAVVVHDVLEVGGKEVQVGKVERVRGKGLFNPQTLHGDIIVHGVKASTYTTAVEPRFAHWLLAPMRALYKIGGLSTAAFDKGNYGLARFLPKGLPMIDRYDEKTLL